jgi:hypothetical protein
MAFPPIPFQEWFLRQTSAGNAALNAYVARVKADGGVVESIGCVPLAVWDWTDSFSPTNPVPPTLLLDLYPNAAAAYSLRKLRAAYSGSAVRVRKEVSSVSSETDIGFLADGSLDTVSLLAFASDADSGDVFVVTWYDQSLSNDATQSTAANQPKIVSSGAIITEGTSAKPAIDFDGVNDRLSIADPTILPSTGDISLFSVFSGDTASAGYIYSNRTSGDNRHGLGLQFFSGALRINGAVRIGGSWNIYEEFLATANQQYLMSAFKAGFDLYVDGVKSTGSTNGLFTTDSNRFNIGANTNNGSVFNGNMQEIVFYASDETANRTAIETNINTFYSIYP